jgi:flagellar protein FlaG
MNINEVASHAVAAFSPRIQANSAPVQQTDPETGRMRDAAASSPNARMPNARIQEAQQTQTALADDPSARNRGGLEEVQTAVEKIQEYIRKAASDIKFSIDEDSGRTVVKVIDRETEEVIRQIPSQEALDLAQALDKLQGLLIKQKA